MVRNVKSFIFFVLLFSVFFINPVSAISYDHNGTAWTVTNGDDYDLNPAVGIIDIAGYHWNITEFLIPDGTTVNIKTCDGNEYGYVRIEAISITVNGILTGNASGYIGGDGGACPDGDGQGGFVGSYGGLGSSAIGLGGNGVISHPAYNCDNFIDLGFAGRGATAGATYGTADGMDIDMGAGGGGGGGGGGECSGTGVCSYGPAALAGSVGGLGGGMIYLDGGNVSINGSVFVNGGIGGAGGRGSDRAYYTGGMYCDNCYFVVVGGGGGGGVGGAGGGVLVIGNAVTVTGTITSNGGVGGVGGIRGLDLAVDGTGGGTGGGGRIKLFYRTSINITDATIIATGSENGSIYNGTAPESVNINGTVYNASSMLPLSNAKVSLLQLGAYFNTTTNENGNYTMSNMLPQVPINFDVAKTGYTHENFSVTPLWAGNFTVDLYMLPTVTGVHGLVVDYPWNKAIYGSTVWLWNATYNTSTTTNQAGYYLITGVNNSEYTMNASATGYTSSDNVNTTVVDNVCIQSFVLSTQYNLTVTAVDSTNGAPLTSLAATIESETISTTTGTADFLLDYGLYYVTVASNGYYSSSAYAFLDEDESLEIELTPTASQYYAPHNVKFTVKSLFGTLYSGVTTNVYLGAAATGDVEKTGTTGTDGAVAFEMTEDVQYTITFIDATQGINKEITLYPKNDGYTVYVFLSSYVPDDTPLQTIQYGITSASINLTAGNINASFNDSSATFTHANFTIRSEGGTTLYAFTTTDTTKDWSQTVSYNSTTKYTATIEVFNTALTSGKVMKTAVINFNYGVRPEYDFGWSEQWQYQLLGACLMLFIGGLFSAGNAHLGAVIVVGIGWFNLYAGWFPRSITAGLMMLLGTLLAVAFVMRKQENKI